MTVGGVGTHHFTQAFIANAQDRKEVAATQESSLSPRQAKDDQARPAPVPTQDQVSLSKEAQRLLASDFPSSKNSTFQQSPSPFDR